jgi:hypothetical protein
MMNVIGLNKITYRRQTPMQVLVGAAFFQLW